jgi:hypothetical protein
MDVDLLMFLGINTAERYDRYQTLVAGVWRTKTAREDSCRLPALMIRFPRRPVRTSLPNPKRTSDDPGVTACE